MTRDLSKVSLTTSHVDYKSAWKEAFSSLKFSIQFGITVVVALSFTILFHYFFPYVESRNGTFIHDLILEWIPPHDVSYFVFLFLYAGIIIGLYTHRNHPKVILVALQTYVLVTLTRVLTIQFFPLEPPNGYLPLKEPFVQLFTPGGEIISKDLFFSGHMSTILSVYFATRMQYIRAFLLFCCMMVGAMVLIQHVHYTIDVIVAIPATYAIYHLCKKFLGGSSY